MRFTVNFLGYLLDILSGQGPEHVVIGNYMSTPVPETPEKRVPTEKLGKVLTWDEATALLSYPIEMDWNYHTFLDGYEVIVWCRELIVCFVPMGQESGFVIVPRNPSPVMKVAG